MISCCLYVSANDSEPYVDRVRLGVFAHNLGLIASRVEHGIDLNGELVFQPLDVLFNAEPTLGVAVNLSGYTSHLYAGLSWEIALFRAQEEPGLFLIPFMGFAIHDGKLKPEDDRRGLGCRLLFRESIDLGWRFSKVWGVSIMTSHLSHGGLCANWNQGLDNSGLRLSWRF